MKKLFILFIVLFSVIVQADGKYDRFIMQQFDYINQMSDENITSEKLKDIAKAQEASYVSALEHIMSNKKTYLEASDLFAPEIYALNKKISINKRADSSEYAIIRDEVQINSYKIIINQVNMIRDILLALDKSKSIIEFTKDLDKITARDEQKNQIYKNKDYKKYLKLDSGTIIVQLKQNIEEFYNLLEINDNVIKHLYMFKKRMHRLNKYSKYHLISTVIYLNNTYIGRIINPALESVGLNIMKIFFILSLSTFLYFVRRFLNTVTLNYLNKIDFLEKYSNEILQKAKKPLSFLIILINAEFVIYIYNDFLSIENISRFFNVSYAFILVWLVFRLNNIFLYIKMQEIEKTNKNIKNEMINVGTKMINFLIIIIGLLWMLYLAGIDLTAVLSGLGIGGLAVALAAKDTLSNFLGTISILVSDVFSQGDWIVVDGKEGTVIEIGLRVTTLRTFDNALIAIPNSILANKDVKNWNKRTLGRRIKMSLGIKYNSKQKDIENAVNEIRTMLEKHPKIATKNTKFEYATSNHARLVSKDDAQGVKKTLLVYLDEFSSSSINILVYCFTKSVDWQEWLITKEDVMHKIMAIFEKNNLEFAFPSLSIYNEDNQ